MTEHKIYLHFSRRIKQLRAEKGLTQKEFAEIFNIKQTSVSHYENGTRMPENKLLFEIAKYFNVSGDWLAGNDETTRPLYINPEPRFLPILGTVSAGVLETPVELADEQLEVPSSLKVDAHKLLAIRCTGDSMNKVIPSGFDLVVIKAIYANIKDGDIVVFRKENEFSVKRFFDMGDVLIFKPESFDNSFKTIIVDKETTEDTEIIGKVLHAAQKF